MAIKIKYHSPLPGTLTPGLVFSLLDAFLHFKNFIKALLQCGKCQREMHWRQIGISLIVKLLLLTDVLLCLLGAGEWNARLSARQSCLFLSHAICWKLEICFPAVKYEVAKVAGSAEHLVDDVYLQRLLTRIHVKIRTLLKRKNIRDEQSNKGSIALWYLGSFILAVSNVALTFTSWLTDTTWLCAVEQWGVCSLLNVVKSNLNYRE